MKRYSFDQLVFASTPSRMVDRTDEIMRFVSEQGKACLHPFNAMPFEYYEGGALGRDKTLDVCHRLIAACDELWLFGISDGTMFEVEEFLARKPDSDALQRFRSYVTEYDDEWQHYFAMYAETYPAAAEFLAGNYLPVAQAALQ
jgi:hypothetical protein